MANTDYSDMLGEVLPYLAADPSDPVTEGAIKRAVIEFCTRTWLWKHASFTVDVAAGVSSYTLTPPTGSIVVEVLDMRFNGSPITGSAFASLNATQPGWMTEQGTPRTYTQIESDRVILTPTPDATQVGALVATLILAPGYDSTGAPQWIMSKYRYALAEGAISRLMLMPGRPWTDLQGGIDRRDRFESHMANARMDATHGTAASVTRTTPQH